MMLGGVFFVLFSAETFRRCAPRCGLSVLILRNCVFSRFECCRCDCDDFKLLLVKKWKLMFLLKPISYPLWRKVLSTDWQIGFYFIALTKAILILGKKKLYSYKFRMITESKQYTHTYHADHKLLIHILFYS